MADKERQRLEARLYWRNNTRYCMEEKEKKDKTVGGQVLLYI
jgi:hypothetical protein